MTLRTIFLPALLASLAAVAGGCASDPSKKVETARNDEAQIVRERQEQAADRKEDRKEDRAEERRESTDQLAETKPRGTKERVEAEGQMTEVREKYRGKATARLEKANAKLTEAQKKVSIAGTKANLDVKSRIDTAAQQRTLVSQQISQLPAVKDDQWDATTKTVDKRLDELESLVDVALEKTNKL